MKNTKSLSKICFFLVLACLILHLPVIAHSTTYYVNGNTGNDTSNDGSQLAPWKTIGFAVNMASGQDSLYIHPGSYTESIDLKPIPKRELSLIGLGTDDNLPVIQSINPDTHTIDTTDFSGTLQGLAVTGATNANGMNITGSGSAARILNCRSYGNRYGIHVTGTSSPLIRNSLIFNNSSCGIGNMVNSSAIIDGNQIYANGTSPDGLAGICVRDQSFPVIQNNNIRENHLSGINIRNTAHPTIVNNTLLNHREQDAAGVGIKVNQEEGIQSLAIFNNIIAYNDTGLHSQAGKLCTGNNFNNFYSNSTDLFGFVQGNQDIFIDPLLSGDFCLSPGSPCIDAGITTGAPNHDINGSSRPQGTKVDIGACEYLKGTTGNSGSSSSIFLLLL